MKIKWMLVLLAILLLGARAFADDKAPVDPKIRFAPENYKTQMELAKSGKPADYFAMRLAYSRTSDYSPYERKSYDALKKAYYDKKYDEAIKLGQDIVDKNFVDMDAHMVMSLSYEKKGDKEKSQFHRKQVENLVRSIAGAGDGKSQKTAYIIINIREEYILMKFLGVEKTGKDLQKGPQNQMFDVMKVKTRDGKEGQIFFNVTIPFNWLSMNLNKVKK